MSAHPAAVARAKRSSAWVLRLLGIDGAVSFGILTQIWTVSAGLVTIGIITRFLSPVRQGFFYTFRSLIAIQIFFELGLSGVLAVFFSHEFHQLNWGRAGAIEGHAAARLRCVNFLAGAVRWFTGAVALFVLILVPLGIHLLDQYRAAAPDFASRGAWLFAVLAAALFLFVTPLMAILLGSGEVKVSNALTFYGSIGSSLLTWLFLVLGHGMIAVAGPSVAFGTTYLAYFVLRKPRLLRETWREIWSPPRFAPPLTPISWRHEVWPMQWRVGLSWLSGYFIFQLLVPLLFHFRGAVVAGQMGMTLSAVNALAALGFVWVNVKNPIMARLVAQKHWAELDSLFVHMLLRSVGMVSLGCAIVLAGLVALAHHRPRLAARLVAPDAASVLLLATVVMVCLNAFACYLRAHKQEPLMVMSVTGAVLQAVAAWYCAVHFSSLGVSAGFCAVCAGYMLPYTLIVWRRRRAAWHRSLA